MKRLTRQQAYEHMRAWFAFPGQKLGKVESACRYRMEYNASDLQRCAVGCLIPDKFYGGDPDSRAPTRMVEDEETGRYKPLIPHQVLIYETGIDSLFSEEESLYALPIFSQFLDIDLDNSEDVRWWRDFLIDAQGIHDVEAQTAPEFVELLDHSASTRGLRPVVAR